MRRIVRTGLWVWAAWTALALLLAFSSALTYLTLGRPVSWWTTFARSLTEWWVWALLTPVVAWLADRFPIHGSHWRRSLTVHIGIGLVVAFVKTHIDRATFALLTGFWVYFLASSLALQFVVYAAIVAAAHGVEYYRRSHERELLERRLADTRLQLLNLQLQPHFLFNTLNTIAELVHEDPEAADRMITGLADLLRRSLALGGSQEIPLDTELELLDTYLDIQKTRYGERLDARVSVADEARRCRVPMLLLQPIVENALKHARVARLEVDVRLDTSDLVIEVTDNGPGAADEAIRGRTGIGLGNTRERLATLYGTSASLELSNVPAGGARVTVRLPGAPATV